MFQKIALTATALFVLALPAGIAQAGNVYYPDEEYVVRPRHHQHNRRPVIVIEEEPEYRHQRPNRHGYYQKKVLVDERPTYKTCRYVSRWDAYGNRIRVEDCR